MTALVRQTGPAHQPYQGPAEAKALTRIIAGDMSHRPAANEDAETAPSRRSILIARRKRHARRAVR